MRAPAEADFRSRLRSATVTARVGLWLGVCFGVCFATGLISHAAQTPAPVIPFPSTPAWGYRVTQGIHVATGTAAVPLLLVKLWSVYPRLFRRPARGWRRLSVEVLERGSIAVLVGAAIFQLATGLANSAQWYPWPFSFRASHYAVAWIAVGSLIVHVAVKLPVIRTALSSPVDDLDPEPVHPDDGALSRRGLLRATWLAAGVAVLATAGSTLPALRRVSVLATRSGEGPGGVPINKSAAAAGVTDAAAAAEYRLAVVHGSRRVELSRAALLALPQSTQQLPIACVEGWSADGTWTGVPMRVLLDLVGAPRGVDVVVTSLQRSGPYRSTVLQANFADDTRTLLALSLAGEPLSIDHGYPARVIAPNRPGVLQTKWVASVEVAA